MLLISSKGGINLNYIAEIRAFYDWVQFNPIPAGAQALWHTLMYLNNKCAIQVDGQWYWRVEFSVSNTTLLSILKFSRQQLDRMRNALIQAGRIEYKKGRGNQSGFYKMNPFDANYVTQAVTQSDTQIVTQVFTQTGHSCCTLNNNNINPNPNLSNDDVDGDARTRDETGNLLTPEILFSECFQQNPSPVEIKNCESILRIYDPDLVEYAFERAAEMGQKNLAYVRGILNRLRSRGIKNMGDMADYDMSHEGGRT